MTVARFINTRPLGLLGRSAMFNNAMHLNIQGCMVKIYMTSKSGKIVYRNKIDTIIGIIHPGIVLGEDQSGIVWVIHNHYKIGHPEIVTLEDFADGVDVLEDMRKVSYSPSEIVERAIECWNAKNQYSWLLHNCQHFVNKIVLNQNHSEAIDKIANGSLLIGAGISLYGALTGKRTLIKIGLTMAAAGLGAKGMNN